MPKIRVALPENRRRRRSLIRTAAAKLLTVLAVVFWPACSLLVGVLHAEQFAIGIASLTHEPLGTFAWHQALVAVGPWGSSYLQLLPKSSAALADRVCFTTINSATTGAKDTLMPDITLEEDAVRARALADQLAVEPCADVEAGETRCIERENNVARKKGEGFTSYRTDRMCDSCAVYWHAEIAALRLEQALWLNRMLPVTDDQRSAG